MFVPDILSNKLKVENFTSPETWDLEMSLVLTGYALWVVLWVFTIINAIKVANKNSSKNVSAALVLSVLSWPFFWVFKIYGCFGKR
jgi:hypothetical protein